MMVDGNDLLCCRWINWSGWINEWMDERSWRRNRESQWRAPRKRVAATERETSTILTFRSSPPHRDRSFCPHSFHYHSFLTQSGTSSRIHRSINQLSQHKTIELDPAKRMQEKGWRENGTELTWHKQPEATGSHLSMLIPQSSSSRADPLLLSISLVNWSFRPYFSPTTFYITLISFTSHSIITSSQLSM